MTRLIRASALVLVLALAACGDDEPDSPSAGESAAPEVTSVEDVQVATLTLTGEPDWLAADEHGLWVQQGSGELVLVDPTTNEQAGSVDVGAAELCQGLGASFGAVWTCEGSDVVRVDPDTFEVVARLKVKKQAVQGHLVGDFEHVWVLTGDGSSLVGIDPATNRVATEFELPARCSDVSLAADALWLPCRVDDRVLKVDPASGKVLLDVDLDNPVEIAVDGDVWIGTATSTVQLNPDTGEVLAELDAGSEPDGGVDLDADSVWVRNSEDFLLQFDRETGAQVQQITADVTSGGDMLILDGNIWISAYDDQTLFRLDPSAGGGG